MHYLPTWIGHLLPKMDLQDFFPIGLEINKGALVYGNMSTHHLLALEFQNAEGTYGTVQVPLNHISVT
jgi:hypothetical protein